MKLLSVRQAAKELKITEQGMRSLISAGVSIDPKKVIRVNKPVIRIWASEIEKLKKRKKRETKGG